MRDSKLRVSRLTIHNVMGIEEIDVKPGSLTLVSGPNGSGKTSVLEAIRATLGGGHDATLIRNDAESGEVVIILDDGTRIEKTIKPGKSTLKVTDRKSGDVAAPQRFLNNILDGFGSNPIKFLTADKNRRVQTLLEMAPLDLNLDRIAGIVSLCTKTHDLEGSAPFDLLDGLRQDLYDHRTGVNRSIDDRQKAVRQIRETLPPEKETIGAIDNLIEEGEAWVAESRETHEIDMADVTGRREKYNREESEISIDLERARSKAIGECKRVAEAGIAEINARLDARLDDLKDEHRAEDAKKAEAFEKARDGFYSEIDGLQQELSGKIRSTEQDLATLAERRDMVLRADGSRKLADEMGREVMTLTDQADELTGAIDDVDTVKRQLTEQIPIDGVEVREGDLYVDGVPFDRVNESTKVRIAIQLAEMRCASSDLPLVCVDGLEKLDSNMFSEFVNQALDSPVQFIVSRVSDDEKLQFQIGGV